MGGCYECTNETLMMHEIYNFGPIVAAINAGPDFISHKKGMCINLFGCIISLFLHYTTCPLHATYTNS